ncbi:hypothetical protein [Knoellia subterranea]|uniref:hypothetical protein n=1 Tax=Knoellia subterranea TaxID=184882 RepID=UPI0012ECB5AD|nr:hypothetical protein [Knoellia subterranea]
MASAVVGSSAQARPTAVPALEAAPAAVVAAPKFGFQAIAPTRLYDSRSATKFGNGTVRAITAGGRGGIPTSGVGSVALNVTATQPTTGGWLKVWPAGQAAPSTSTVNFVRGATVANTVVVGVDSLERFNVGNYGGGSTHVIVDVTGWFPTGSGVTPLTPRRLLDTRGSGQIGAGQTRALTVTGNGVPTNALAVALTVTATRSSAASSWLTIYPYGATRPGTSSVNMGRGQTVANSLFATVGTGGRIQIYNAAGYTDVIVDITGYLSPTSGYVPLTPVRIVDTRAPYGDYYRSGWDFGDGFVGDRPAEFNVTQQRRGGTATVPFGPGAAVTNVTVTGSYQGGYLTVWPAEQAAPASSSLNYAARQTVANGAIVGSPLGGIQAQTGPEGLTHVIVDVSGYFPTDGVGLTTVVPRYLGYATGQDRIAVLFCAPSGAPALNRSAMVANLNGAVRTFYESLSRNRYTQTFTDVGAPVITTATKEECLNRSAARTQAAGYDGALSIWYQANEFGASGLAGPGYARGGSATYPSNQRDGVITSTSILKQGTPNAFFNVTDHELGHMLSWWHSYWDDGSGDEYNNVVDLMSGGHANSGGQGLPDSTVAVNRLMAGWIDPGQVRIHKTSGSTYTLAPIGVTGTQLLAVPSGRAGKFVAIDARVKSGYDQYLDKEGVTVHLVEQWSPNVGDYPDIRISPAKGPGDSVNHVLAPGQSMTLGSLTIRVGTKSAAGTFPVTVTGTSYNFPTLQSSPAGAASKQAPPAVTDDGRRPPRRE